MITGDTAIVATEINANRENESNTEDRSEAFDHTATQVTEANYDSNTEDDSEAVDHTSIEVTEAKSGNGADIVD